MDGEQLSISFADVNWKTAVEDLCADLVSYFELPLGTIYLAENRGREGKSEDNRDKVISYSVSFYEPEYPEVVSNRLDLTKNTVIMNIRVKEFVKIEDRLEIQIHDSAVRELGAIPGFKDKGPIKGSYFHMFHIGKNKISTVLPNWLEYIKKLVEYELKNYISKSSMFGCCSRFVVCSDMKKCVHPNKLYACACYYKHNLEEGRIFYGQNRNVESEIN